MAQPACRIGISHTLGGMDDRIRMDTAGEQERRLAQNWRPAMVAAVAAAAVVTFGLLTTFAPGPGVVIESEPIDPTPLVEPESEAGFRPVARIDHGPWESFRISHAYLSMGESPTVITDDDKVVSVDLPELEVLFGAISAGDESVAFGSTADGPALWRSPDATSWSIERLPWDGTVRAGAQIDGRLVLIGIERYGPSFHHVTATETESGWQLEESNIPDPALISVPGGFVGRGRATDQTGFGYLFSADGLEWTFGSNRLAASPRSIGQVPSFVIETDRSPRLQLPGDGRILSPPAWPVSGLWKEGEIIWAQTADAAWSTSDGTAWTRYPIDISTGVGDGFAALLPVGDTARLATSAGDGITLLRWYPGTTRED